MERIGRIESDREAAGSSRRFSLDQCATVESNRITCITKPHPHSPLEHITHVGGVNSQGQSWYYARQRVADMIDSGRHVFRVKAGRGEIPVSTYVRNGSKFIRTIADGTARDHILSLDQCPLRGP